MFTSLPRCLRRDSGRSSAGRLQRQGLFRGPTLQRRSFVPRLEALECRAQPSTFTVLNLADSGAGSLRQAILDANGTPGDDTITFSVTGTIQLAGALPNLSSNIDIQGPGAEVLTVRGGYGYIFGISPVGAAVQISGLTISNGGGGIANFGTLTVRDC